MVDSNLDLDIDWVGHDESRQEVARVCVASACRFTRNGGAPTISADCPDLRTLESEINRLKSELDAVAQRARDHFGQEPQVAAKEVAEVAVVDGAAMASAENLLVKNVMTAEVVTVDRNDQVSFAEQVMDVGHFRHVVVLDEQDEVAGIISRQDIYYGALAWSMGLSESMHDKALRLSTAKAVMRADVITISPDASIKEAAQLMVENKIGCLPVVDGVALVGILTEGDLLALMALA